MGIRLDAHELVAEAQRDADVLTRFRKMAIKINRKVSFDTELRVKKTLPVLTGRARASWGHWSDSITMGPHRTVKGKAPMAEQKNAAAAGEADSIYEETRDGLTIVQGSALPYIEPLNEGHSKQAPSGFLDVIADEAGRTLETALLAAGDVL